MEKQTPRQPRPPDKLPKYARNRPAGQGVQQILTPISETHPQSVSNTSTEEGIGTGLVPGIYEMYETWKNLAASESRLELMTSLKGLNLGLAEVEEFNLGLNLNFRNERSRVNLANENKVVKAAMESKFMDEIYKKSGLTRSRNKWRGVLADLLGKNRRRYNTVIKKLRSAARAVKSSYKQKYRHKITHLQKKYKEDEEDKLDKIPEDIEEFKELSVFSKAKFEKIIPVIYDTASVGEMQHDEDEKAILCLNPGFSVMQNLPKGGLEFEKETSYAKARMEIGKELGERVEGQPDMSEEEVKKIEEMEAKTRITFDPETKEYNDQNRRVTDLQECSRVTLPRPLPTKHEAFIEIRRDVHERIFDIRYSINIEKSFATSRESRRQI